MADQAEVVVALLGPPPPGREMARGMAAILALAGMVAVGLWWGPAATVQRVLREVYTTTCRAPGPERRAPRAPRGRSEQTSMRETRLSAC